MGLGSHSPTTAWNWLGLDGKEIPHLRRLRSGHSLLSFRVSEPCPLRLVGHSKHISGGRAAGCFALPGNVPLPFAFSCLILAGMPRLLFLGPLTRPRNPRASKSSWTAATHLPRCTEDLFRQWGINVWMPGARGRGQTTSGPSFDGTPPGCGPIKFAVWQLFRRYPSIQLQQV